MITNNGLFWILIGAATAGVYLITQQWSVNHLDPQRASRSVRLIVGGAILRWVLISIVLVASILHSNQAILFVVVAFMIVRFSFLLKWHYRLKIKNLFLRQS